MTTLVLVGWQRPAGDRHGLYPPLAKLPPGRGSRRRTPRSRLGTEVRQVDASIGSGDAQRRPDRGRHMASAAASSGTTASSTTRPGRLGPRSPLLPPDEPRPAPTGDRPALLLIDARASIWQAESTKDPRRSGPRPPSSWPPSWNGRAGSYRGRCRTVPRPCCSSNPTWPASPVREDEGPPTPRGGPKPSCASDPRRSLLGRP